jgi:hypothetical protein
MGLVAAGCPAAGRSRALGGAAASRCADPLYIGNDYAKRTFSKLRSSIGGLYAWRLGAETPSEYRPKSDTDRETLSKEADLAFRQAFALCPYSPEAVFRYVQLLRICVYLCSSRVIFRIPAWTRPLFLHAAICAQDIIMDGADGQHLLGVRIGDPLAGADLVSHIGRSQVLPIHGRRPFVGGADQD